MSRLDRFGDDEGDEPPEDDLSTEDQLADEEPCGCDNGWLDYLDADHPTPCLRCKPHLAGPRAHLH